MLNRRDHLPTLVLKDLSLYYEFYPLRDKPVLVLSNSLGTGIELWRDQVEAFRDNLSVLVYDARGQGNSSVSAGPYTIGQMGGDVLALLDALELPRVHFCGISMGGLVGQWLAVYAPTRLHKLVLSNTAAKIGTEANWNQRIATVQQHGIEAIVSIVMKGWFTKSFSRDHPDVRAKMKSILCANTRDGYVACCAAVRDADFRKAVQAITTPTLVIYGDEDHSTSPDEARFLFNHIPGARALELQAAHISNIEAASAFTQGVLQFLIEGGE